MAFKRSQDGMRSESAVAWWLGAALLGFYVVTMTRVDFDFAWDGLMRYETVHFWLEFGIAPESVLGPDFESKYFLGGSLAMAPLFLIGWAIASLGGDPAIDWTQESCLFLSQLITALGCVVFFRLSSKLSGSTKGGLVAAVVYGVATMAWPYAVDVQSEPLVALCLSSALYALYRYRIDGGKPRLAVAGLAMALAILTRAETALQCVPLGFYALHAIRARRESVSAGRLAWLALPASLGPAGVLAWNYLRYGTPMTAGYVGEGFTTPLLLGLYGLLFSSGKGLFFYNPVLILTFFGWRRFFSNAKPEAAVAATVIVIALGTYAKFWNWAGDAAWGPRFLVTVLPFALFPVAWLRWPAGNAARAALVAVVLASAGVQALGVLVPIRQDYAYKHDETHKEVERFLWIGTDHDPLVRYLPSYSPLVRHARALPGGDLSLRWFPYDARKGKRSVTAVGALALLLSLVSGAWLLREVRAVPRSG